MGREMMTGLPFALLRDDEWTSLRSAPGAGGSGYCPLYSEVKGLSLVYQIVQNNSKGDSKLLVALSSRSPHPAVLSPHTSVLFLIYADGYRVSRLRMMG